MPNPAHRSEAEFHELERWVKLRQHAPKMLDALRLIYFAVTHDHDSAAVTRANIKTLCEAALKDTEDIE